MQNHLLMLTMMILSGSMNSLQKLNLDIHSSIAYFSRVCKHIKIEESWSQRYQQRCWKWLWLSSVMLAQYSTLVVSLPTNQSFERFDASLDL